MGADLSARKSENIRILKRRLKCEEMSDFPRLRRGLVKLQVVFITFLAPLGAPEKMHSLRDFPLILDHLLFIFVSEIHVLRSFSHANLTKFRKIGPSGRRLKS